MRDNKEYCPHCKADLQGEPILDKEWQDLTGATHYSRKIGIYDINLDRTVEWMCPDCEKRWKREW